MGHVQVRVQPGAKSDRFVGKLANGTVKIAVTAPPEDGRANAAVTTFVANALGIRNKWVRVSKGASSRSKTIEVDGWTSEDIAQRLDQVLADRERE